MIFDLPIAIGVLSDFSEGIPVAGIAIYMLLPFAGAAWLLSKSWRVLLAAPVGDRRTTTSRDAAHEALASHECEHVVRRCSGDYLFLWIVVFMLGALVFTLAELVGLMDDFDAPIVPWKGTLFFLTGAAAVAGYVALLLP
jgi:hypothetical protein